MNDETSLKEVEAREEQKELKAAREEAAMLREQIERLRGQRHYVVPVNVKRNTIRFGLVGDPQVGSIYSRMDALREFYALLAHEKIKLCLNAGDILDGHGMYRGQEFEQCAVGMEKQLLELERQKPDEPGIRTIFITGNHDYSCYKQVGAPIWDYIAQRSGWTFAGRDRAWIELATEDGRKLNVGLAHPSGGTAYAVSYKSQKYVEAIPGGGKPDILGIGHFHKADWMPMWRNMSVFQVGCFQSQTPFMATKPTDAHVGGWIVKAVLGDRAGLVSRVTAEFVAFYEPTERVTL